MCKLHQVVALLEQREDGHLVRRELRVQTEDDALLVPHDLLSIRVDQEGERGAIGACGCLHDPRGEGLLR